MPVRLVSLLRRPEVVLFLLVLGCYAYFYQAGGWNQNSRFDLTRAIVERGTVLIDAYHENTGDKALRDGHYYCDKAPGLSLFLVPGYAMVHALAPASVAEGAWLATVLGLGLPSALACVQMLLALRLVGVASRWAAGLALAWSLGTLAFPYSTLLYGHQLAAALAFSAFALVWRGRSLVAAGLLAGLAVTVDYSVAVLAVLVTLDALSRSGWRAALRVVLGGLPAALLLGTYHLVAFGSPWSLPYDFVLQDHRRMGWFMGIGAPQPGALGALLFGEYRGLFWSSPWLVAGIPGLVLLARAGHRGKALVSAAAFAFFLLMNAGMVDWHGGWAVGPRLLLPGLPFLAFGASGLVLFFAEGTVARRWIAGVGGALVAYSMALMLIATAVRPEVSHTVDRPFTQVLIPHFLKGHLSRSNHAIDADGKGGVKAAWNLGQALGLSGHASLLPLALWVCAASGVLVSAVRRDGRS